jgi:predicted permease
MNSLGHDIRYSVRRLVHSPVTTAAAVLSLALGIGANTAIFSLINALVFRALPIREPAQLVRLFTTTRANPDRESSLSLAMYQGIRENQRVFSDLFAWEGRGIVNIEAKGVKYAAGRSIVTGEYFSTLGIRPILGRAITPQDLGVGGGLSAAVAVIDYDCWQTRYNGDPAVVGKTIRVEDRLLTIIGVTPKSFSGITIETASDVTVPIGFSSTSDFRDRRNLDLWVFGRLKPGISIEQARAQLESIWPATLEASLPDGFAGTRRESFLSQRILAQSASTGTSFLRETYKQALFVLMTIVALVLLIACANLANLMLALSAERQHEFGIRYALGSGRWRIVQEMLAEGLILSGTGAVLGVIIAGWATRFLILTMAGLRPIPLNVAPDLSVLAFTALTSLLTGLLFSAAPAWSVFRKDDPGSAIKSHRRSVPGGVTKMGKALIAAQVALSLALVMGASLFVRSLRNLHAADLGFRPEGILTIQLFPQSGAERQRIPNRVAYYRELAERLQGLPGVASVSFSHFGPVLNYEFTDAASVASSQEPPVQAVFEAVGPGFFHLAGMRVLEGREFNWRDDEAGPPGAIISESLASRLFPSVSPIGRRIDFGRRKDVEIVGVVNSASLWMPQSRSPMAVYLGLMQMPAYNSSMIDIRTAGDPATVLPAARRVIESLGRHLVLRAQTLDQRSAMILNTDRILAMLSSFFGGLAVLLAAVGLYGIMSYRVSNRTAEIGVRMALGARPSGVLALILRDAAWAVGIGMVAGIGAALGCSRLVSHMVYSASIGDPPTILFSASILVAVAGIASYLPARRASRIEPMTALRSE